MPKDGQYIKLPTNQVHLDKDNPRIRKYIAMYGSNPTGEQIHQALGAGGDVGGAGGTTFTSLKESILTHGTLIHPIIVNHDSEGKYIVIEGNTRLAIYNSFAADEVVGDWSKIPCMVYEQLDGEIVNAIRLQAHLVGPRPWDAYSKGQFLHNLRNIENLPFARLVDYCGGRKKEVENYITAFAEMEAHYRKKVSPDEYNTRKFSSFVEIQKSSARDALFATGFNIDDFSDWIIQGKFGRQEEVRLLSRILPNEKSRKIFLDKDATAALKVLEAGTEVGDLKDVDFDLLGTAFTQRLREMNIPQLQMLKENPSCARMQMILDLRDQINIIIDFVDIPED